MGTPRRVRQTASWIWALGLGLGLTSLGLSVSTRQPVLTAWSTPGAALLVTAGAGLTMAQGVGAFMVCALWITVAGATGWFARVMDRIPQALASALLVGVMFAAYLLGRRLWPRYAVPG